MRAKRKVKNEIERGEKVREEKECVRERGGMVLVRVKLKIKNGNSGSKKKKPWGRRCGDDETGERHVIAILMLEDSRKVVAAAAVREGMRQGRSET